jgi:hypothetical protein
MLLSDFHPRPTLVTRASLSERPCLPVIDGHKHLGELGRQPYTARRLFLRHANRVVFGLDTPPSLADYRLHYRFLETGNEHFNSGLSEPPTQGRSQE